MTKFIVASLAGLVAGLSAAPEAPAPRAADRVAVVVDASGPGAETRIAAARADAARRHAPLRAPRTLHEQLSVTVAARRPGLHHDRRLRPRGARRDRAARRPRPLRRRRLTLRLASRAAAGVEPAAEAASEGGSMKRRAAALCALAILSGAMAAAPAGRRRPTGVPDAVVALGDSAISGEAGRWAGNTNKQPVARRRARLDRVPRRRGRARRSPAAIAPSAAEIHIGGVESANLACSGARTYTQPYSSGSDFKPGPRLLRRRRRPHRPGQGAAAVRAHAPRAAGRRPDRREQLRLRRRRPDLRDRLAHVAVVVEELLQRRRERHAACSRPPTSTQQRDARDRRVRERRAGDGERRLRRRRLPARRADVLVADPARQRASATRRPASRARRSAAAASGTATPTGPTTRWSHELNERVIDAGRGARPRRCSTPSARSPATGCARAASGCSRSAASRTGPSPGAADQSEWVSQIRTVTTLVPPYQLQEDLHPSYWGQLALRNCVRQVYAQNRGGTCRARAGWTAPSRTWRSTRRRAASDRRVPRQRRRRAGELVRVDHRPDALDRGRRRRRA